jgi:hypothetical protein
MLNDITGAPMPSTARRLAKLSTEKRHAVLGGLSPAELQALDYEWAVWARPDQLPPPTTLADMDPAGREGIGQN